MNWNQNLAQYSHQMFLAWSHKDINALGLHNQSRESEPYLSGAEQDVIKLHANVFLTSDLLQNLHKIISANHQDLHKIITPNHQFWIQSLHYSHPSKLSQSNSCLRLTCFIITSGICALCPHEASQSEMLDCSLLLCILALTFRPDSVSELAFNAHVDGRSQPRALVLNLI